MSIRIHHFAAISSNINRTIQFYHKVLGLHYSEKRSSHGATRVGHFFCSNIRSPFISFYHCPGLGKGQVGVNTISMLTFMAHANTRDHWYRHFKNVDLSFKVVMDEVDETYSFFFNDPDGLQLRLIFSRSGFDHDMMNYRIIGITSVEISVSDPCTWQSFFMQQLKLPEVSRTPVSLTLMVPGDLPCFIDIVHLPKGRAPMPGSGRIHHLAFEIWEQQHFLSLYNDARFCSSQSMIRNGFRRTNSVYLHQAGGVLLELFCKTVNATTANSILGEIGEK